MRCNDVVYYRGPLDGLYAWVDEKLAGYIAFAIIGYFILFGISWSIRKSYAWARS